ncbi:hypothetical protein [Oenococcus sicerae]|uniref:hypothetical protein n=1 Tax=Oenococcus sicerae TaxID=2203724 RepID=UPI0039EC6906
MILGLFDIAFTIFFSVFLYYRHSFYQVTTVAAIAVLVGYFNFAYNKNKSLNEELKEKNTTIKSLKKTIKELKDSSNQSQIEYIDSSVSLKASGLSNKDIESINTTIRSLNEP